VPERRDGRKAVAGRHEGPERSGVTAASAVLALLLAQRAFNVPPSARPQPDPALTGSAAPPQQATPQQATPPQAPSQQAAQEPAGAGSTAGASADAAGGGPAGSDGEQLRQAREELQALRSQVAGVEVELQSARTQLAEQSARAKTLEDQLAAVQQKQAQQTSDQQRAADEAARQTQQRAADTSTATQGLADAQQSLALGSTSGVDSALVNELQRLEQARQLAVNQGSNVEALRADTATRWVQEARDALARGDLAAARSALAAAQGQAAGASALSGQAAGTGSAAPPAAAGGTGY
jgi:hypothetical protein